MATEQRPEDAGGEGLAGLLGADMPGFDEKAAKAAAGIVTPGDRDRHRNDRDGGGIPTTTRAPMLTAGGDPVNSRERLGLRDYTINLDGIARMMADRQLNDNAVDRRIDNRGMRRWLEIGLPPEYRDQLPEQRRFRFERKLKVLEENSSAVASYASRHELYLPPGFSKGKNYLAPVTEVYEGTAVTLPDEFTIVKYEQHFWVLDMDKPERASRDFTGFCRMPKHYVLRRFRWLLVEGNLLEPLLNAADPDNPVSLSLQQKFDIRRAFADARESVARWFYEYPHVVEAYDQEFLPAAKATGVAKYMDDPNEYQNKFYFWFHAQERYWFWKHFEKTAKQRDQSHRVQNIPTAIAASEALADLMSAVVNPLPTSLIREGDRGDKTIWGLLIHWGAELVRYAPGDEVHDLRKTIDFIKQYLMLRRTRAQMLLQLSHVKSSGDLWYPGSWDNVAKGDFVLSIPTFLPNSERGERLNQVLQEVLYGPLSEFPDDFDISPGPEIGEWHGRMVFRLIDSFNTLLEMANHVREGGGITDKDLREKWFPKLVQFGNDTLVRGWWDHEEKRLYADYDPVHPDREFRAVPYWDWFLWADWAWVIDRGGVDHYVFSQIVKYVNERMSEAGLPEEVWIGIDGPDPNYFRHHEIAREIWRHQPFEPIKQRLEEHVVGPIVETGELLSLRTEVEKFFSGMPIWRIVGTEEIDDHWLWPKMDLMDLFEDYLMLADDYQVSHIVWLSIDGYARIAEMGDVKGPLKGGFRVYPTERLATRYPEIKWGRVDRPDDQYSPFTLTGMQRSRLDFEFISYDANFVAGAIRALVDKLQFGVMPTVDEVYDEIMSNLGSRRFYPKRLLNVLDYIKRFEGKLYAKGNRWNIEIPVDLEGKTAAFGGSFVARTAFGLMRKAVEKILADWDDSPSHEADLFGALVIRDLLGEVEGYGGWVDAVQGRWQIDKIRGRYAVVKGE